jgi:hypothetical protein
MEMRPDTAGTREKEGRTLLFIFGGQTLAYSKYIKADYNYQPFLGHVKKNMNEGNENRSEKTKTTLA